VNERHSRRLEALLEGQEIYVGGQRDANELYIAPTILRNVSPDSAVMQEEIFGPILPVLKVPDLEAAIAFVNERPKLPVRRLGDLRTHRDDAVEEHARDGSQEGPNEGGRPPRCKPAGGRRRHRKAR